MGILDHIMSEDEMKQDAESFAKGLPDRGYQIDGTFQEANKDWIDAIQNVEADAAKDAEIWANKLPDKK